MKTITRSQTPATFFGVTVGTVVDVNDPQQQGRIRVFCPALGDREETALKNLVWASYAAPFGGMTQTGTRGPERATSNGPVAYGMWAIPKVGSHAFIMCLDGNPIYRIWIGSLYGQFIPHTMPSGRWLDENKVGPLTSTEQPLEPLYSNSRKAFGDLSIGHEGRSRMADNQVSAVDSALLSEVVSTKEDPKDDQNDNRKGYQHSRQRADLKFAKTGGNFDSQVYSITTPGMHSFSMDDSIHNGRIRIRSTSGNQIILDDTNERIYVSTPEGKNWIELDRNGNIDVYSERRISMHAEKGFNFKTEGSFIVEAEDIHLNANTDMRLTSNGTFDIRAESALNMNTSILKLETTSSFDIRAASITLESLAAMIIKSTGILTLHGLSLDLQPTSPPPGANISEEAYYAFAVNRSTEHEPWGRIMSIENDINDSFNTSSTLELSYDDENVGKVELGETITRNEYWRR